MLHFWKGKSAGILICLVILQSAGMSVFSRPLAAHAQSSVIQSSVLISGKDTTSTAHDLTASELDELKAADNNLYTTQGYWPANRSEVKEDEYLSFNFQINDLPPGAVLDNVVVNHYYQPNSPFSGRKYELFSNNALVNVAGTISEMPDQGANKIDSATFNLSGQNLSLVNPQVRFLAYYSDASGHASKHDYVSFAVNYHVPATPTAPVLIQPENNAYISEALPTLVWQASTVEGGTIDHYAVSLADNSGFANPILDNVAAASTSYTLTSALPDGLYFWQVAAFSNEGKTNVSSVFSFTVDTLAPEPPLNVFAQDHPDDNGKAIDVSWQEPTLSTDIAGYEVGYSPVNDSNQALFTKVGKVTAATISVPANNTPYYIFVRSYDLANNFSQSVSYSEAVQAIENLLPGIPSIKKIVITCDACTAQVDYTVSGDVTSVKLIVTTTNSYTATPVLEQVQSIASGQTGGTFQLSGLAPNTAYYFHLVAYDANNNVAFSEIIRGFTYPGKITTIIPNVGGVGETVIPIPVSPRTSAASGITTAAQFGGFTSNVEAAENEQKITPTPSPTKSEGKVEGGKAPTQEEKNASRTHAVLLVILLIAAALAAYFGYRSIAASEETEPKTTKKKKE